MQDTELDRCLLAKDQGLDPQALPPSVRSKKPKIQQISNYSANFVKINPNNSLTGLCVCVCVCVCVWRFLVQEFWNMGGVFWQTFPAFPWQGVGFCVTTWERNTPTSSPHKQEANLVFSWPPPNITSTIPEYRVTPWHTHTSLYFCQQTLKTLTGDTL
jgi:hypothetical protein